MDTPRERAALRAARRQWVRFAPLRRARFTSASVLPGASPWQPGHSFTAMPATWLGGMRESQAGQGSSRPSLGSGCGEKAMPHATQKRLCSLLRAKHSGQISESFAGSRTIAESQYVHDCASGCTCAPHDPQRAITASTAAGGRLAISSPQRQVSSSVRTRLTSYWEWQTGHATSCTSASAGSIGATPAALKPETGLQPCDRVVSDHARVRGTDPRPRSGHLVAHASGDEPGSTAPAISVSSWAALDRSPRAPACLDAAQRVVAAISGSSAPWRRRSRTASRHASGQLGERAAPRSSIPRPPGNRRP
jgi:hypothetical protein